MLTIRESQKVVLTDALLLSWLRHELTRLFPRECLAIGPAGLSRFIPSGLARAKKNGFTRDESLPYLAMEICFGEGFLEAAQGEWARKALDTPSRDRMQSLYRAAIFHLAKQAENERRQQAAIRESAAPEPVGEEGSLAGG